MYSRAVAWSPGCPWVRDFLCLARKSEVQQYRVYEDDILYQGSYSVAVDRLIGLLAVLTRRFVTCCVGEYPDRSVFCLVFVVERHARS